ncbi:MAG: DUF5103 domain-containing protein [Flavobacteriales bacterium]|nr:DUF5103 domain-containing protein [Flavobacteriales bacterium]
MAFHDGLALRGPVLFPFASLLSVLLLSGCGSTAPAIASTPPDYWQEVQLRYEDHTYSPTVHTVQLFKRGFELAPPVTFLDDLVPLVLRFDDLGPDIENYSYTVVHCSADWEPSDIMPGQYLEGAMTDYVPTGRQSYNTLQPFIHYELEVPNGNMRITRSGNYLLQVFRDNDPEDLVLTRRFLVGEQALQIDARILASRNVDLRDIAQQVDLTIRHPGLYVQDPFGDIHVTVLQNMRWDDARTGFKPRFVRDDELVYDHPDQGLFMGANEFRNFDLKNLRYATRNVGRIDPGIGAGVDDAFILPETKRNIRVYDNQQDLNGKYLVRNDLVDGDPLGADYVNVHFALPMGDRSMDDVFVYGGLSDFQCRKEFRMEWSPENSSYMTTLLLKQGFYDFTFVTLPRGSDVPDLTTIEGSHFQTENDYLVLVYLTDHSQRYDRLVGVRFLNSVRD